MSHRYDQCDATCTIDCGHCKGAGKPEAPRVSRASIARKMREGFLDQGWMAVGPPTGSWLDAAERICQHLERNGIEVHR